VPSTGTWPTIQARIVALLGTVTDIGNVLSDTKFNRSKTASEADYVNTSLGHIRAWIVRRRGVRSARFTNRTDQIVHDIEIKGYLYYSEADGTEATANALADSVVDVLRRPENLSPQWVNLWLSDDGWPTVTSVRPMRLRALKSKPLVHEITITLKAREAVYNDA